MDRQPFYWLNEDSRVFLSRGYLSEGETPESRIRDIADKAEWYLKDMASKNSKPTDKFDGFADKFYDYMGRGYYSLSSPVWANYGKQRGLPVSCLTGDSWINTEHEGGTQIKNLKIGDKVLTHKGRFRKVVDIQTRQSTDDIYELKVKTRNTPIKITGNHPVLTNLGWVRVDELDSSLHYIATNQDIEHVGEEYTIIFDEIVQDQKNPTRYVATQCKNVKITEDVAWAMGLWFAEGSKNMDANKIPNGIRITMGIPFKDTVEKWSRIMKENFGLNGGIYESNVIRNGKENSWLTAHINSVQLAQWFTKEFGDGCKEKNVTTWIKNLPKPVLKKFFEGFYLGDGNKTKPKQSFTISNPKLAMSLYEIGLRCGYRMGLQMQEKASKLSTTSHVYRVNIYDNQGTINLSVNNARSGIKFSDGNRYCPFTLKKLNHNEMVYDITVEEDHSFSVSGVIVHNCFGSFIDDTMESIMYGVAENGMLMKNGGGTSGYFGKVRHRGAPITDQGESSGSVHFMQLYDTLASVVSQGSVRRGFFAAYQDIEHPDADEFLDIGTEGNPIQGLTTSVIVSDKFINDMKAGDQEKRKLWAKVLQRRSEIGYPYVMFGDNVNKNKPKVYKDKDMWIYASQMCSEISLPSSSDETFTCVLSSLNVLHWDEIKNTDAIEVITMFLDTVCEEFIRKTEGQEYLKRARKFSINHRALGLGILGWHSYLQSNMIPFESNTAARKNLEIAKALKEKSYAASGDLAEILGEPPLLEGYGMRNTTTMAIAPTKSSSFILGQVSQSIELEFSNCYVKDLAKIKVTIKNPYLEKLLKEKGKDTPSVWDSIKAADGSVQLLDFLTQEEKDVFKTFSEVNPYTIIDQAAVRQEYIDQSQSLNLMLDPTMSVKDINALYLYAWEMGIKNLYYSFSMSAAQSLTRKKVMSAGCAACEA
jgi:ribonucleoside-diphosphate reductase alpha chain